MNHPSALFLSCGAICYDSTSYFEQCISQKLREHGWHTEHVCVDKKNPAAGLAPYYGKHFDIIFDVSTILPAAVDADGALCLDKIGGQIWHYVLDHPMYHHSALKCHLQNYNVLCLDEKHMEFIKTHYLHIRSVHMLPLAALAADAQIPYEARTNEILFTGTYTDPDSVLYQAMQQPAELAELFQKTVQLLLDEPELTQEEAICRLLPVRPDRLPEVLQLNYLADIYLQAVIREELIRQLLLHNLPVTIYGHGWEQFAAKQSDAIDGIFQNLHLSGEATYDKMPEIFANSKIALNQTPWFKAGMHDRVPLALQNGCACMTEECPYMKEHLADRQQLYYFSLEDMEGAALLARQLLKDPESASQTAARGYAYAQKYLSWESWVENFMLFLSP